MQLTTPINYLTRLPFRLKHLLLPVLVTGPLLLMSFTGEPVTLPKTDSDNGNDSLKGFKSLLPGSTNIPAAKGKFPIQPQVTLFTNDYVARQGLYLENMKTWGQPYFTLYENILSSYGLPVELKYLSVIESGLQANQVSSAGAAGPWQLMPAEARRFGLVVNSNYDERRNFQKSTVAAAKLLKELYGQFGDWLLVVAAYNGGVGSVQRAMKKSHSASFWDLQYHLPEETRNHVKKYIATHYYFEQSGGWTTLTAAETKKQQELLALQATLPDTSAFAEVESLQVSGKLNSLLIANAILMDIAAFNQLNPLFDKTIAEGKPYTLRLPAEKMTLFKSRRQQILQESVQLLLSASAGPAPSPPPGK